MIEIVATTRGTMTPEKGAYLWRGELRIFDNEALMGWYVADEGAVRSRGTMYFALHQHRTDRPRVFYVERHRLYSPRVATADLPWEKRLGSLESITKQAAVVGVLCYAIGLLTINSYLLQFGVVDFDVVRPRFALVGLVTILIVAVYPLAIWIIWAQAGMFREARDRTDKVGICILIVTLLFGPGAIGVVFGVDPLPVVGMLVLAAGFDGTVLAAYRTWFNKDSPPAGSADEPPSMLRYPAINMSIFVMILLILLGAMVGLLVRHVIEHIPEQFGGVQPRSVVIVVKKDSAESLAAVSDPGLRFDPNTLASRVQLLYEAQSFVLVRTDSERVVWLDKDNVVAIDLG